MQSIRTFLLRPLGDRRVSARIRRGFPRTAFAASLALALLVGPQSGEAAERTILMKTHGDVRDYTFEPRFLHVSRGDTVRFKAVDRIHATQSVPGMIPEGARAWRGRMGEDISVRFAIEGVYGFLCKAHYTMGMVGLILVGNTAPNLAEAGKVQHPLEASQVYAELLDQAGCVGGAAGDTCAR